MTMRRIALLLALLSVAPVAAPVAAQQPAAAPAPAPKPQLREFQRDSAGRIVFDRETFAYNRGGRRDPFASLIATGDIRPLYEDLMLTGVIVDPAGRNSIALIKDASTNELYRARIGSVFGRLRVTSIQARSIGITIDEFGFSRQETLTLNAPRRERTP